MAMEATSNSNVPSPQVVGNVFVEQYYHILHASPELVYRFYQDNSILSRPDLNGEMKTVTTMKGINDRMMSLNFKEYKAEIKTADAQKSLMGGVTVLVSGCLTDKDNVKRKFAQSFFLAPQDNGYFVLNDLFRYVDDVDPCETEIPQPHPSNPESEISEASEQPVLDRSSSVEVEKNVDELDASESEKHIPCLGESVAHSAAIEDSYGTEDDAPKKSYASIVKVAKSISIPVKVYVPTNPSSSATAKSETNSNFQVSLAAEPETAVPSSSNDYTESKYSQTEAGYSVFMRNLPSSVTVELLETEFAKFGPIKHDGVQVRYNNQGYCFGFVEFLSMESMHSALQASPVTIDGRHVKVEIKRAPVRAGVERGRLPSGRSGFRNDNFRGRGGYGGRVFFRNETTGRFSPQSEVYYHQGRGRGSRPSAPRQNPPIA